MSIFKRIGTSYSALLVFGAVLLGMTCSSHAGFDFFGRRAVGGIAINAEGLISEMTRGDIEAIRRARIRATQEIPEGLERGVKLRKVSLRDLQQAIADSGEVDLRKLPHHIRYLAGLQRVQYVFVYPEKKDIVLVGPGEGWTVNDDGVVVGETTQLPVMNLEDLISTLRFAFGAKRHVISCSIDPTAEGMKRFATVNAQLQARPPKPRVAKKKFEEALGPQVVTVEGIDPHTRFARVLVAADYRMKRLAMGIDKSPIRGLPSFLSMIKSPKIKNMMPRWWLEDDYEAIHTDEEGLSFEIRGGGVKAMTEEDVVAADGTRSGTGKASPLAQKWADNMTKNYEALSRKSPIFAELRNCMDLSVVAALIASENLTERAGMDIDMLLDDSTIRLPQYAAAKQVPTIVSHKKIRGYHAFTASGGVSLNAWRVAARREQDAEVGKQRATATEPESAAWWWN